MQKSLPNKSSDFLFLFIVLLLGLTLRLDQLIATNFVIDADEAIVGLMAKHIAEGQAVPTFYYGQHYMGSFEAIVASWFFKLFGVAIWPLKIVPLIFSLLLVYLTYLLAYEIAGRTAARTASLLMAIPPAALVVWSAKARGGFIELVFVGTLSLLVAIRALRAENPSWRSTFALGLILGFGWWINNQILYFIPPITLFYFYKVLSFPNSRLILFLKHFALGVFSFFFGGLPYWLYNVQHDFVSLRMFKPSGSSDILEHLIGLFSIAIPIIMGGKRFWETDNTFPASTTIVYLLYGGLFFSVLWARRKQIVALFKLRADFEQPVELLLLFVLCTCGIFVLSSFGYLVQAPRYLLPLYPVLFALIAFAIYRQTSIAPNIIIAGLVITHLASSYFGGRAIPGEPFVFDKQRVSKDHSELVSWLEREQITWVRTNYWIGYRLAFETKEKVKFSLFQEPRQVRIDSYKEAAEEIGVDTMPLVLVPNQTPFVKSALNLLGYSYAQAKASGYDIIYQIKKPDVTVSPIGGHKFTVGASHHGESALNAVDSNLDTRWGSAQAQKSGMKFTITFNDYTAVRGFSLDLGAWQTDFPRGLRVIAETDQGQTEQILSEHQYNALVYLSDRSRWKLILPAQKKLKNIELIQTKSDNVFDWSIAELEIYE